jgi:6,7-dimethyl-8-ribityllumazine synthase
MVQRTQAGTGSDLAATAMVLRGGPARLLLIEAPFYRNITDALATGAIAAASAAGCSVERIAVPGALEIPQALALAARAGRIGPPAGGAYFQGAIALGCVIRGETTHYETVCDMANHWLMQVATEQGLAVGNGILTVENEAQALARADGGSANKGGDAARAAIRLIDLARTFAAEANSR